MRILDVWHWLVSANQISRKTILSKFVRILQFRRRRSRNKDFVGEPAKGSFRMKKYTKKKGASHLFFKAQAYIDLPLKIDLSRIKNLLLKKKNQKIRKKKMDRKTQSRQPVATAS